MECGKWTNCIVIALCILVFDISGHCVSVKWPNPLMENLLTNTLICYLIRYTLAEMKMTSEVKHHLLLIA